MKRDFFHTEIGILLLALFSINFAANPQTLTPVNRADTGEKVIAYTFDDGPYPGLTERFLEYFETENVRVTFFNMGKHMLKNPELTKKTLEAGHELGNHSMNHLHLPEIENEKIVFCEINEFQLFAKEMFDYEPKIFRAPYLQYDEQTDRILAQLNLTPINAAVYARDGNPNFPADSIVARVLENVKPGDIILSHERENTLKALRVIIPELKKRGYKFVTVSELLDENKRKMK